MGVGPFAMISSRAEVIDYFQPIFVDYIRVMGGSGSLEVDSRGFILPLGWYVWAFIFASFILLTTVNLFLQLYLDSATESRGCRHCDVYAIFSILVQQRKLNIS